LDGCATVKLFDDSYIEQINVTPKQRQSLANIVGAYLSHSRILLVRQIDAFLPQVIDELDIDSTQVSIDSEVQLSQVETTVVCANCAPELQGLLQRNLLEPLSLNARQLDSFSRMKNYTQGWIYPVPLDEFAHLWCVLLSEDDGTIKEADESLRLNIELFCTRLALKKRTDVLQEARTWIDAELGEMARLQHLLLPDSGLKIPGVELAFRFKVFRSSGGDYIDITSFKNEPGSQASPSFGAIIADVAGHGPSATIEAVMMDAILRTFKPDDTFNGPGSVLTYINQHFFTRRERGRFVTACIFNYQPETRMLGYACAGHPHAYIKRGDQIIRLDEGSIPVGVVPDFSWETFHIPMLKDDILFMYTDVVIETRGVGANSDEFGFERLEAVIAAAELCPHRVVDDVEAALLAYAGRRSLDDDLTLCGIQITA